MDTIFSSASGSQKSAIKIIRISGSKIGILPKIFSFKPTQPRIASLRKIYDVEKVIPSIYLVTELSRNKI